MRPFTGEATRLCAMDSLRRIICCGLAVVVLCLGPAAAALAQLDAKAVVLVATPQLRDPLFAESVVLVTRHGRSRPFGVILNRPLPSEAAESRSRFSTHIGGPVSPNEILFVLRGTAPEGRDREVLALDGGLLLGFGRRLLANLAPDVKREQDLRVYAGFSAWAFGQLEAEIARGDWRVLPYDPALILRPKVEGMWRELWMRSEAVST